MRAHPLFYRCFCVCFPFAFVLFSCCFLRLFYACFTTVLRCFHELKDLIKSLLNQSEQTEKSPCLCLASARSASAKSMS
jgi:hypothetical protein